MFTNVYVGIPTTIYIYSLDTSDTTPLATVNTIFLGTYHKFINV